MKDEPPYAARPSASVPATPLHASRLGCLAELAAGIALTFSELVTALVGWVVAKLRGHDLFDEVVRDPEAEGRDA